MIFFSICQNFLVFRRGPPSANFSKFSVEFLGNDHMKVGHLMVPLFSVSDPLSEKLSFFNLTQYLK